MCLQLCLLFKFYTVHMKVSEENLSQAVALFSNPIKYPERERGSLCTKIGLSKPNKALLPVKM